MKRFFDIRGKKRKHSRNPMLSIFDEVDRKISKVNDAFNLFYFTKIKLNQTCQVPF